MMMNCNSNIDHQNKNLISAVPDTKQSITMLTIVQVDSSYQMLTHFGIFENKYPTTPMFYDLLYFKNLDFFLYPPFGCGP